MEENSDKQTFWLDLSLTKLSGMAARARAMRSSSNARSALYNPSCLSAKSVSWRENCLVDMQPSERYVDTIIMIALIFRPKYCDDRCLKYKYDIHEEIFESKY